MPSSYSRMSLEELRLCALEGDTEAEYLLGQRLLGQRGRAMEGMEHLKNAAKKRHLQACERLGSAYLYGEGDIPQDKKQAMVYYEQALALGSTTARTQLTRLYLESEDRAARGLQLLTESADAGDKAAAARAARLYLTGEIGGVDIEKAAKYAALSGDSAMLYETAERLETLGVEPEMRDNLYRELLKKDREGEQLGISACLTLARMYEKGKGTKPDGRAAERLLRRAMDLEKQQAMAEPRAELQLAGLYEAGAEGLPANHDAARRLLQTVAKGGSEVARLRYIRLCTQDGLYLEAYRASAEAQKYGEALRYVLENWENIPDPAAFVDRALLFAGPSRREGEEARALRQELYRRALLAGSPPDRVLADALRRGDAAGALAFFQELNDADKSAVYENRELCASLPEGGGAEADKLRALLAAPPEEFRRYAVDLARLRACTDPAERWSLRQSLLPTLPPARSGEARPLSALRQALLAVPEPPKPAPPPQPAQPEPAEPELAQPRPAQPEPAEPEPAQPKPAQPGPESPAEAAQKPTAGARKPFVLPGRRETAPKQAEPAARKPFVLPGRTQPAEAHTRRKVAVDALPDGQEIRARVEALRGMEAGPEREAGLAELDERWKALTALFAMEDPADAAAVRRARRFAWEVLEPASALYEGRRAPAFDAVCGEVLRVLEGPNPEGEGWTALRARWDSREHDSPVALHLAVDTLHSLPPETPQDDPQLAQFRAELREALRAGWQRELARLQDEGTSRKDRQKQASALKKELLLPAQDLYAAAPCPEYAAVCAAADRLLQAAPAAGGADIAALRAQREKLRRDPVKAMRFAIDALRKLPEKTPGEEADLSAFRAELREELRARWEMFLPYFDPASSKSERNPKVLRERARFFAREFLGPAQSLYENAPCAEYDALCAAVERVLPEEKPAPPQAEEAPDWEEKAQALSEIGASPDALRELAGAWAELPQEAAGEAEPLARYRAALVQAMRGALLELCQGLDRCAPQDRKRYAETALRRLELPDSDRLPVAQEWEEARSLLRGAAQAEARGSRQKSDRPARAAAPGWKERLDAFNALNREEEKRAFAQGPMGDLPAEAEDEDVNLTILRLLLEPYRQDLFSERPSAAEEAPPAPEPEEETPPPRRRRKRRFGPAKIVAVVLLVLLLGAAAAMGLPYLAKEIGIPVQPVATSSPDEAQGSDEGALAQTLMDLTPTQEPAHYYLHRWTNPTHSGDFQLLDGDQVRTCDGIGWFVPSSAIGEAVGAQGSAQAQYDLGGAYEALRLTVSADQDWNDGAESGSFRLTVFVDDKEAYTTGWGDYTSSFSGIEIDLRGAQSLTLVLEEARGSAGTLNIVMGDLTLA
ncbi:MAG: NPCBM/NEW2 domain-containing protein [Candidatus Spyradocola sp.]|jgi:TPR repeat protein